MFEVNSLQFMMLLILFSFQILKSDFDIILQLTRQLCQRSNIEPRYMLFPYNFLLLFENVFKLFFWCKEQISAEISKRLALYDITEVKFCNLFEFVLLPFFAFNLKLIENNFFVKLTIFFLNA